MEGKLPIFEIDLFGRISSSNIGIEHEVGGKKTNFQEALKVPPGAIGPRT